MNRMMDIVRGFSVLLSDLALASLAVLLVPVITRQQVTIGYPVWMGYLAVQFLLSYWLMELGISMNSYLIFQTVAVAAGSYLTCRVSDSGSVWGTGMGDAAAAAFTARPGGPGDLAVFLLSCTVATGLHSAWTAYRLPGSNTMVRYVDGLAVTLAFYLYAVYATGLPVDRTLVLVVSGAMVLDLLVVNRLRTGEECPSVIQGAGNGARVVLVLFFAACLALTGGIVGLASGQVHSLVDVLLVVLAGIWKVVYGVAGAVGMVLGYLILFVIALLPNGPPGARERVRELVNLGSRTEPAEEYTGSLFPAILLCGLAVAGVLALLYQLRGIRVRGIRLQTRRRKVVRKSHLLSALWALAVRCLEGLGFAWDSWRYRKTPPGLLVLAERAGRKAKMGRRTGESPGAYLRRLAAALRERETAAAVSPDPLSVPGGGCGLDSLSVPGGGCGRDSLSVSGGGCGLDSLSVPGDGYGLDSLAALLDRMYYNGEPVHLEHREYLAYAGQIRALLEK